MTTHPTLHPFAGGVVVLVVGVVVSTSIPLPSTYVQGSYLSSQY
jgi:hypothetical protein